MGLSKIQERTMIGLVIHDRMTPNQRLYSGEEKTELWRHLDKTNPAPILFMLNTDWLKLALDRYPGRRIAFRRYSPNDGNMHINQSWENIVGFYRGYDDRAFIQVLNEPNGYDDTSLKCLNEKIPLVAKEFARL